MSCFPKRAAFVFAVLALAGCSPPPPPPAAITPAPRTGVTLGGADADMRGTIMYQPAPLPKTLSNPYASVSDKFVIGKRQQMAWALAEIDQHAHLQALHTYPVPDPSWQGYTKQKAGVLAQQQAKFNAYLLEKYHARFCNQFHITYDQLILIVKEGRDKNWPMPPAPQE